MEKKMEYNDLLIALKVLEQKHELEKKQILYKYIDANNPYKVGDKFTDHIGTIIIEEIKYSITMSEPCCVYFGTELKKDGTPKKNNIKRGAYQLNEVKGF